MLTGDDKLKYQRRYQRDNRERLLAEKAKRREAQRTYIQKAKEHPCADCNVQYPYYVMEFDHVRGKKRYNLNRLAKVSASWATIDAEIAKCDVVCANCHRERTYTREIGVTAT